MQAKWCLIGAAAVAAGLVGPWQGARAASFQLRETSAEAEGTALAGAGSAADSPATVFSNPAGMTQLPGVQVSLGGSLVAPSFAFSGSATDAFGRPIPGGGDRDGGSVAGLPQGYVTARLAPDWTVGVGFTTPYGQESYYGPGFVGRFQADKTMLETFDVNPSVAWQATPWLSLGAGVSANYAGAEFTTGLNSGALAFAALGRPLPLPDGLAHFSGNDWAVGYDFGALLTPAPGTRIGLTYRSALFHTLSGTASNDVPFPLSASPLFRATPAQLKLVLPATLNLSLTQTLTPRLTGYAEFQWTDWSRLRSLSLVTPSGAVLSSERQGYRDGVFAALGASYRVTDRWTVRAGTAFDKSPANPYYLDIRLPDANRYWLAAGTSYRVLARTTLDFAYAHVFVDDASIHQLSATDDLLVGRVASSVDIVSLAATTRF